jgi:hypothetical protein
MGNTTFNLPLECNEQPRAHLLQKCQQQGQLGIPTTKWNKTVSFWRTKTQK